MIDYFSTSLLYSCIEPTGQKVNSSTQINESNLDNKVTVIRNTPPQHYFTILCV